MPDSPSQSEAHGHFNTVGERLDDLDAHLEERVPRSTFPVLIGVALSDETTELTTGDAKVTIRAPYAFDLGSLRGSLTAPSSSGAISVDVNVNGSSILSVPLTIDQDEKTSTTATPAVISSVSIPDDAEITFDIDAAGAGAAGLKVWLIGTRILP